MGNPRTKMPSQFSWQNGTNYWKQRELLSWRKKIKSRAPPQLIYLIGIHNEMFVWLLKRTRIEQRSRSSLKPLSSDIDGVNTWDRVIKLIETSQDAVAVDERVDVSRMRKLFIHLKNEPISA